MSLHIRRADQFTLLPRWSRFVDGRVARIRWLGWELHRAGVYWEGKPGPAPKEKLPDGPGYAPGSEADLAYRASEQERGSRMLCYGPDASAWAARLVPADDQAMLEALYSFSQVAAARLHRRSVAHSASIRADLGAAWADDEKAQADLFPPDGF